MRIVRTGDNKVMNPGEPEEKKTGWDPETQTYYGKGLKIRKVGTSANVVSGEKETPVQTKAAQKQAAVDAGEEYYKGVLERLSQVDEETKGYLDQLREGMPEETVNMQGIADNRSWEERYAEEQAWYAEVRRKLQEKGYDDTQIAQLADDRARQVNRENYEAEVAKSIEEAQENGFKASAKSVAQNLTGGLATLDLAMQNAHKKLTGDETPVDYYRPEMIGQAKAKAARETVSQRLEESTEFSTGLTGNVAVFLYNTGMSMADSAASALLGSVFGGAAAATKIGGALLGGTAATQAAVEAKERGVSDEQALMTGLVAGAAEMFFERYSLGNLLETKPAAGTLKKQILGTLKNAGMQAGVEGSEEMATSIANQMADAIINGDKSKYDTAVRNYMDAGMTLQEASKAADKDWVLSLAQDFLGGAVSGGVMGGGASVLQNTLDTAAVGSALKGTEEVLTEERRAQKAGDLLAQRVQEQIKEPGVIGGTATNLQRRELLERTVEHTNRQAEEAAVKAAAKRLKELGEKGDTEAIARAAVKSAAEDKNGTVGQIRRERTLGKSEYGQQVTEELRSGAEWTKELPQRVTRESETARLGELAKNPKATDKRTVTGAKFNAETGKMDAIVKGEDGKTETVPMETANVTLREQKLADYAAEYGKDGSVMMKAILPRQDVDTYTLQWKIAYEYGSAGVPKDYAMKSPSLSALNEEQKSLAYDVARKTATEKAAQKGEKRTTRAKSAGRVRGSVSMEGATIDGVTYGAVNEKGLTKKQQASVQVARVIARETGVNIVFYESTVDKKGRRRAPNGVYKDGTIYLDIAAGAQGADVTQAAILRTAAHELTHFIQDLDDAAYQTVRDFVLEKLVEKEGVELEDLIAAQMRKNPELNRAEATDEVIADACEMMLKDSTVLQELAAKDRSLAEKLVDFLLDLFRKLQQAFEGVSANSAEAKAMADYTKELQKIWSNALQQAVDTLQGTEKNTAENGGVKYQVREEFVSEIDAWDKARRPDGEQFVLGSTGPVLQGLGAIESDIYMQGDKIKTILQDHPEMTLDEIKKIPQILEDPVLVLKSRNVGRGKQANTRMVIFGSVKAQNGNPVFAVLDLRPVENGFAIEGMQKVNSAYTKSTEPVQFVRESYVLHADKKRTAPLLRSIGFQMPIELLRDGSIGSISYRQRSVNLYGEPFSSVVGEKKEQKSMRDTDFTDREILAATLESSAQTERERVLLEQYRRHAMELRDIERELDNQRKKLQDHESGKKPLGNKELTQTRNSAAKFARKADKKAVYLHNLEVQKPLQAVLARERAYIEETLNGDIAEHKKRYEDTLEKKLAEQWAQARYWQRRYEDVAAEPRRTGKTWEREVKTKLRKDVRDKAGRLVKLIETNTDKKHVPEDLKEPLRAFLSTVTFTGWGKDAEVSAAYARRLQELKDVIDRRISLLTGDKEAQMEGYLDLPQHFKERLEYHLNSARETLQNAKPGETVVNRMSMEELEDLDMILSVLSKSIRNINELMANRRFGTVEKAAEDTIHTMHGLGAGGGGKVDKFFSWENLLPVYAFKKLGKGAESIFEGLQDGWDKLAQNSKKVIDFTQQTYTAEEARRWSEEVLEVEVHDGQLGEPVTIKLTVAQIMSLWALSRREQALGHLLGGGIRPEVIEIKNGAKKKTIRQEQRYKLTQETLYRITDMLTPRQLEVARKLQRFMEEQGSAWGNEISMERHGYKFFGEKNYFPIETDKQLFAENGREKAKETGMYRLMNLSATKPLTEEANNALMLRNIFDVYANHMADMAKYNAMVLPILDAVKWYNYFTKTEAAEGWILEKDVKQAITAAYGRAANDYIVQLINDINGVREGGGRGEELPKKMISNYKRASVAANLRVALLQPTSYARALAVMEPKYLAAAVGEKTTIKAAAKEMLEHSGIALWKSMGFFDTDVGRGMRDQIKGTQGKVEQLVDKSMLPAQKMDEWTWAILWKACKKEQQSKGVSADKLMEATALRFREVVYATQVVDSTMTRSALMRDNTTFKSMATAFMSEPTVSYNVVMEAVDRVREDTRRMGVRAALKKHSRKIEIAFGTYVVSALVSAFVESLADAYRDDDDEKFWKKYWDAFSGWDGNMLSNLNPIGKVAFVKDAASILSGQTSDRIDTQAITSLYNAVMQWREVARVKSGKQENYTEITYYGNQTAYGRIYQTSKALSQLGGLPMSAAMREVQAAWNGLMGLVGWDGLKWKTYENKDQTSRKKLYEAMVSGDKVTWNKETAAWKNREIKNGAAAREALSTVESGVKQELRDMYWAGEVTETETETYLTKWLGMKADEAKSLRLQWQCYIDTGIKWNDIRSGYETGKIDEAEVIRLRQKYGGDTREEAQSKATFYRWGVEFPEYADLSESRAVAWYDGVKRTGLSAERYYEIAMDAKDLSGKKEDLVTYIRKLNVTGAQKRALWYALKTKSWKDTGTPWA